MAKSPDSRADWSNYWDGRAAGQDGEVFAGVGIETSDELRAFWRSELADVSAGTVLDVACGAGSALKHLPTPASALPIGLDISAEALGRASGAVTGLHGVVGSASSLPIADRSVDWAISQFGFEYAGSGASAEIARVLKPDGRFLAIAHFAGGAIARECEDHLRRIDSIVASNFIPATRNFFGLVFAVERDRNTGAQALLATAAKNVQTAQAALMPIAKVSQLAAHLQGGASQLYERRKAYVLSDITTWLDQMDHELAAYRGRMRGMVDSALDEAQAQRVVNTIDPAGTGQAVSFELGGEIAAWCLRAKRPA